MDERRRHRRVTFQVPATVLVGYDRARFSGAIMDIGEGGVFLLMSDNPTLGQNATVRFHIDADTMAEATGWILRTMPAPKGQGVAIEFGMCNEVMLHYLRNLVAAADPDKAQLLGDIKNLVIQIVKRNRNAPQEPQGSTANAR